MDASGLIKALQKTLQGGGRPHMENQLATGAVSFWASANSVAAWLTISRIA
jgi:hypothetical protein